MQQASIPASAAVVNTASQPDSRRLLALALMVAPEAACLNLQRLAAAGLEGKFGFYEAVDYTASRVPRLSRSSESESPLSFSINRPRRSSGIQTRV